MSTYLILQSFIDKINEKVNYMRCFMQGIDGQISQDISLMENLLGRANNQSTEGNLLDIYKTTLAEVVESLISNGCSEAAISWALSGDNAELLRRPADPEAIAIKESRLMCLRYR